jgi:hypothetical protein
MGSVGLEEVARSSGQNMPTEPWVVRARGHHPMRDSHLP